MKQFLLFLIICLLCISTFEKIKKGPLPRTVKQRGLIKSKITYEHILNHHQGYYKNTSAINFKGDVLAYVTPWNNKGYDIAKLFTSKFNYISPVWFQIKSKGKGSDVYFVIEGAHDVDQEWIKLLKNNYHGDSEYIKIVPRFQFSEWDQNAYLQFFSSKKHAEDLAYQIAKTCRLYGFNGMVMEWGYLHVRSVFSIISHFVKKLSDELHSHDQELILVAPAYRPQAQYNSFTAEDFRDLAPYVDRFSVMTYDYSQSPGPIAPYKWVKKAIEHLISGDPQNAHKILLGLNFYGYDYGDKNVEPILGNKFLEMIEKMKPKIHWNKEFREHYFEYKDKRGSKHIVYYPSLQSIQDRLKLARQLGVGVAIWETGQGLDYFYDLL